MTRLEDYGFSNGHGHSNGNGNGHAKAFTIAKAPPDPETLAIFEARRNCFGEPRRRLDRAKYMFAELCDRATNTTGPGFIRKGSVVVPDSELARKFGVWESTIYTWKRALEACGYIWIEKQWRSDRWPITVYHLTCIHPRRNSHTQNPDGTSNAGHRAAPGKVGEPTGNFDEHGKPKVWSNGARKPGQKSLPLATPHVPPVPWNDPARKPKKSKLLAIVAAATADDWLSATAETGSQPQSAPADSHSPHRLTATVDRGSQPRPNGADSHNSNGATATAERGLRRVSEAVNRGSESKTVNRLVNRAVPAARKEPDAPAAPAPAPKLDARQRESEREFLEQCEQVLGAKEMKDNGGLWRTIWRTGNRTALWACLHETKAMKTERRIKTTAAAAMMDLWSNRRLHAEPVEAR